MADRYTKVVLTVIATALVYLCVVFTPIPGVSAQTNRARPGEPTGPGETVIVGWRLPANETMPVSVLNTVQVTGAVTTERSSGRPDRVLITGWEDLAQPDRQGRVRPLDSSKSIGLPVSVTK